jgi:hypothetical protein
MTLPLVALTYYLLLPFRREEKLSGWVGFVIATMAVLMFFVLPAISTCYLLMVDLVRTGVALR